MEFDAKTLQELVKELNQIDLMNYGQEEPNQIKFDSSSLPTFGGNEPTDTVGIFSWNETHILVCKGMELGGMWQLDKRKEVA